MRLISLGRPPNHACERRRPPNATCKPPPAGGGLEVTPRSRELLQAGTARQQPATCGVRTRFQAEQPPCGGWLAVGGSRDKARGSFHFSGGGQDGRRLPGDRKIRPSTRAATFRSRGGSCVSALRHFPAACRLSRGQRVLPAPSIQVPSQGCPRQPPARMRCWQRWSTLETAADPSAQPQRAPSLGDDPAPPLPNVPLTPTTVPSIPTGSP